jgi:hypothetical protein
MSYLAAPPRDPIKHYTRGNRESQGEKTVYGQRRTMGGKKNTKGKRKQVKADEKIQLKSIGL